MQEDPANRQLVQDISNIWELSSEEELDVNVQQAWDNFRHREIKPKDLRGTDANTSNKSLIQKRMLTVFRAAAAILLIAFAGWFSWGYLGHGESEDVVSASNIMQTLETGKGERAQLTFSDGTVVTLNAASTLRYPKAFKGTQRKVELKGEAYFEVAPNKDRPFIVDAGMANVEVLGTKFNVRAWDKIGVGVREGKVAVGSEDIASGNKKRVLLNKGEFASVVKGKGLSEVQSVDVEKHMLWLTGGMHFDNAPFEEVVQQIERNFNVQIKITDKELRKVPFTGTFQHAKMEEVLDVVSASMGIGYTRKDSVITF